MFDSFKRYISNKAKLTNQELDKIQSLSIEKKFRKKQYLLQAGDICKHHTFIVKGCMRLYRISNKGVEHVIRFAIEEWWMGDKESLNTGQPSRSNIDALEDSEVLMWTKENHQILLDEIPAFNVFFRTCTGKKFSIKLQSYLYYYQPFGGRKISRFHPNLS